MRELLPDEHVMIKRCAKAYEVARGKAWNAEPHEWPALRNALIDAERDLIRAIIKVAQAVTVDGFRYTTDCDELLRTEFLQPLQSNRRNIK